MFNFCSEFFLSRNESDACVNKAKKLQPGGSDRRLFHIWSLWIQHILPASELVQNCKAAFCGAIFMAVVLPNMIHLALITRNAQDLARSAMYGCFGIGVTYVCFRIRERQVQVKDVITTVIFTNPVIFALHRIALQSTTKALYRLST